MWDFWIVFHSVSEWVPVLPVIYSLPICASVSVCIFWVCSRWCCCEWSWNPDGVLFPHVEFLSITTIQKVIEWVRERRRRMFREGKEVVKWTTAVAIETLLATQHCCYPVCLSANFRLVVSMNILVGSHFSGTSCSYNKLWIWYSRRKEKNYLTDAKISPLSRHIKAPTLERFEAEKPFVIWT